jgi:hypothetical protein|tara:strand:- start:84 stop:593 length:510 start_codon:yes stop_codon:yes gene_type:complete
MAQSNVTSMVENLESGECQLLGPENVLIPEGIYQASYMYYETNGMFAKKAKATKAKLAGGKVYAWFWVDPYGQKLDVSQRIELYMPWNATAVLFPLGRGGKFEMTRKTNYYKDYKRLIGVARGDRISPNAFKEKLCEIEVGTVKINRNQKKHSEADCYSVIRRIIGITG